MKYFGSGREHPERLSPQVQAAHRRSLEKERI